METLRVLLVEDDAMVRQTLARMLAAYPEVQVIAQAGSGDEAVSCVEKHKPQVVIMDIRLPRMDGIAATRVIKWKFPQVQIIGLSEYGHGYNADAMLKAGAIAVYQKSMATEELYSAIKKAGRGFSQLSA